MPTETVIWISAITVVFIIFAAVLAFADRYAHGYPPKSEK